MLDCFGGSCWKMECIDEEIVPGPRGLIGYHKLLQADSLFISDINSCSSVVDISSESVQN